ncbi:hypothetical protein DM47_2151 [Burkholderia mallei]|nr:hypothetical protein DM45_2923 [Burkholderia mallei]KOT01355.1 hypothetical protein DM50_3009 [Burkholderia mallei]KOT16749.1 hypothetical protein DM47_2151 [Burkholderia mallei]
MANDENRACFVGDPALVDPACAQPFGARALEEFQVIRVIDDAAGVGVFVIHADRPREIGCRVGLSAGFDHGAHSTGSGDPDSPDS